MIILGVDPGINGGWAVVDTEAIKVLECGFIPTVPRAKKGNKINCLQFINITDNLWIDLGVAACILEQSQPMPGQGVVSVFQYGRAFGNIEASLQHLPIPIHRIHPRVWKKHAGLIKADKDRSRTKAIELFPEAHEEFALKKDGHKAEAALIAYYGAREI